MRIEKLRFWKLADLLKRMVCDVYLEDISLGLLDSFTFVTLCSTAYYLCYLWLHGTSRAFCI